MPPVIINWPIGSHHGWGIRGLGYALNWEGGLYSSMPEGVAAELPPDDPRWPVLRRRLEASAQLQGALAKAVPEWEASDAAVLVPLGNDLIARPVAYGRMVRGRPTIACPVFEDVEMVKANIERLKPYDAVVVASRWNQEVLGGLGVDARLVHEGIDPIIFNPSVRKPRNDGRFRVFSGGKPEYRKGQDLVIEAFKLFAETHDDAVLVAAWGSPFSQSGLDFEGKWEYGAPPGSHIGRPNFHAWLQRAGLKPHQYEIVEPRANWRMAEVYGSCDVALFPNRCEGGTNFVAMECMACGVPTAISIAFGMDDLLGTGEFSQIRGSEADCVELCVDAMNEASEGSAFAASVWGSYWTWERHCREMAEIIAGA